jgi:HAD superfamily hydrolase (TIGR01509 family)
MTIKALIFDFDGLILDTETPEYHAWQKVYQHYGTSLALSDWLKCVGTTQEVFNPVDNLIHQTGRQLDRQEVLNLEHQYYEVNIQNQVAMPGVMEYLSIAADLGLKLGVASSSPSHWVDLNLKKLNIFEQFGCICTSDHVEKVKPDPALYLCAVSSLRVDPREAIAFEDSLNGLLAAKSAGLHCVVVPNFVTQQLDFKMADDILSSLAEISLIDLLEQFNGRADG